MGMTPQEAIELIESARKTMYLPKSKEYISDFGYALEMAIKALEQTRWIPVSERLPEEPGVYLVLMYRLGYPQREVDGFVCGRWERFGNDVIAWCKIPEPYKESEE